MTAVVFYFQVHQPFRLAPFDFLDIGTEKDIFGGDTNREIARRVADRCYVPMNELILRAIERTAGRFRCAFSISGTALEQLEAWAPDALESFVRLAETGAVEFLCETSHHSLASRVDAHEFEQQIELQRAEILRIFGQDPVTFRNTELIVDEQIASIVERLDFEVLLAEGADHLLDWRRPHFAYGVEGCERLKLLLRDYRFSDDIAFRFSNRQWPEYPLMADRFARWLHEIPQPAPYVGLFMDYETFGEHQGTETGLFEFMDALPEFVLADERFTFETPGALAPELEIAESFEIPKPISWADAERDLSAWLDNPMQRAAHEALYALGTDVRRAAKVTPELLVEWRRLTTSDHVYYMSTKWLSDGDVHEYFSPYDTPHDAYLNFMNALEDLSLRVRRTLHAPESKQP